MSQTHTTQQRLRSLAGLLAVITLLGLIVADTVLPEVTLTGADKGLLITLISALLGVDIATDRLGPVARGALSGAIEGIASSGGRDDGDDS